MMMMTFMEVKGHQGSKVLNYVLWLSLMQVYDDDDLLMEVKGHQRSKVVNYVLWLPNLVRRIPDASLK